MGVATREEMITAVMLSGVQTYQKGQKAIGAGWKAVDGDIVGAANSFHKLGGASVLAGGAAIAAGMGIAGALRQTIAPAIAAERVQVQLRTALKTNMGVTGAAADEMLRFAESLSAAAGKTPFTDEQLKNAEAILATFRTSQQDIKTYIPLIADMAVGYANANGEALDLVSSTKQIGKAVQTGNVGMLRRFGLVISQKDVDTKGIRKAIEDEMRREFGGQAAAYMQTTEGKIRQAADAMDELAESIGTGLLPMVSGLNSAVTPLVNSVTALNSATGGAAGVVGAIAAGMLTLGGILIIGTKYVDALAVAWARVTGNATAATAAQATAGAAAAAAGAAGSAGAAGGALMPYAGAAVGGAAKLGLGAVAIPATLAFLAGGFLSDYGDKHRTRGMNTGGLLGDAMKGGAVGAAAGSVIPGLGTAIGAGIGAAVGLVIGAVGLRSDRAAYAKGEAPGGGNGKAGEHDTLKDILKELKGQTKILGGGDRTRDALNRGDVAAALAGTLQRAVI